MKKNEEPLSSRYEVVTSRDIYELAYYLAMTDCKIESVKVEEEPGRTACKVTLSGKNLKRLEQEYLSSKALVDVTEYRKSLSYIRTLVYSELNRTRHECEAGGRKQGADKDVESARRGGRI